MLHIMLSIYTNAVHTFYIDISWEFKNDCIIMASLRRNMIV